MNKKRVLFITQEMNPYLVAGEIGKIVRKIPQYVNENGMEIRVLMPRFGNINERRNRLHEVVRLSGINIIINDEDFPLIIKVASLPGARIQVYFLDNEEFFKRKFVFRDAKEKFYDDNADRMIFFCKGVLETVRKFGWPPDVIHCHGWMTSLVPLYINTVYQKDPVFAQAKIVTSVYNEGFDEKLDESFLTKAKISSDIQDKQLEHYKGLTHKDLLMGSVNFSDAVIQGSEEIAELDEYKGLANGKPWLEYQNEDEFQPKYFEFYKMLMN